VSWHALLAPAATPAPVIKRLDGEMKRIMATPDMVKKVARSGLPARNSDSASPKSC
jgi:tripartite-type tricarboxylate transporter receptor subunit TctC